MPARIAVDAMGGDHAPGAIIRGSVQALADHEDVTVVLVGRREVIVEVLGAADAAHPRIEIVHATQVVAMDETPTEAIRRKRDSSLIVMTELAATGQVDAMISAGNTGAAAAAAQLRLKTLKCITRPGIAVTLPTFAGPVVLCDVGANIQARPRHLYEYAVVATLYAEAIHGLTRPRVGLVSIGEEARKGTEIVRQTRALISDDPRLNFVGNIEGGELFENRCDVAVADGFVGNVLLKFIEGLSESLLKTISAEFHGADTAQQAQFNDALQRVWQRHDYSEYGGAPLLGVDGVCIICHGRSEERAIRNAIGAARAFHEHRLNETIVERMGDSPVTGIVS